MDILEIAARFPDLHPAFDPPQRSGGGGESLPELLRRAMQCVPRTSMWPRFIKKIASGNVTGSAKAILEANVLAASCSRVCPVEVLCEGACVMHGREEKAIEIGRLQRFAMESYYDAGGTLPLRAHTERKERVACVGAGPASLACAAELRQHGLQVTVLDRRALLGGLNTYGVAEYKLRAVDSLREVEMIRALGVKFEIREIDAAGLAELEREFDAVFLGVGLGAMQRLEVEGCGLILRGLQPLFRELASLLQGLSTRWSLSRTTRPGQRVTVAQRVVVIGAGNTAIDAAIAAKRLGAEKVTILYRRQRENISAFDFEYDHALREGVEFLWEAIPVELRESKPELR